MKMFKILIILFGASLTLILNSCDFIKDIIDPKDDAYTTGDTLWVHEAVRLDKNFLANTMALGVDGSIYYALTGGTVYWTPARIIALNKSDGSLKWESPELVTMGVDSEILVDDSGVIYILNYTKLFAINQNTGEIKWQWEVPAKLVDKEGIERNTRAGLGALALTNNGDLIVGSTESGVYSRGLYGISPNGQMKWYNLEANGVGILSSISIGKDGSAHYYTVLGGKSQIMGVNTNSGDIIWAHEIKSSGGAVNNIIIEDDGKVLGNFIDKGETDFKFHRLDPSSGNIVWRSNSSSSLSSNLCGPSGTIYSGYTQGGLNKYDPVNGNRSVFHPDFVGQAGAINSKGQLLIARGSGWDRRLFIYNEDASEDWSFQFSGIKDAINLISDDKVIYGRTGTQVYAVKGDAKLAQNGWPRRSHDNRNTFNSNKR